jgi:large subunit ribosomal protein L17
MRHSKYQFDLGYKKKQRETLMTNLASALFEHGRIKTTLAKARALRLFAENLITMTARARRSTDVTEELHHRCVVVSRIHNEATAKELFDVKAVEFVNRQGGYTCIYKLIPRIGDAAQMAIIELLYVNDRGYSKKSHRGKRRTPQRSEQKVVCVDSAADEHDEEAVEC